MAFHEISIMDVWEVIRRWHSGQGIREITRALGYDRKTIRRHIRFAISKGISPERPLPPREEVVALLRDIEQSGGRTPDAQTTLLPFLDEIVALVNDKQFPLKPKIAFEVLCQRHDLSGRVSYSSYKRFLRVHDLALHPERTTCRIEMPAGSELQIDYAKVGLLQDSSSLSRRTLYAFIGTLSHSRMKYVELTFRQDQASFVYSHIRMFEFFGGVPSRIVPDNLKSGVISPDLYDPRLNRTYRDMAEHYGTFIDPARVVHPKDKGKVERDVQTARQAARKVIVLNPLASPAELNRLLRKWSLQEYGLRPHGTTGEKPFVVLSERERPALKPLPESPFELATWKQATVHPDQYIQFHGKAYSVPFAHRGKKVWIRATEHIVQIFLDDQMIKQHAITREYRHTDYHDFPENVRAVLDTPSVQRSLLTRAESVGPHFHAMIKALLEFHAYINLRSAMGLTREAERWPSTLVERAARFMTDSSIKATPRDFRTVLEKLSAQENEIPLPLSDASREFIRDTSYFINDQRDPS